MGKSESERGKWAERKAAAYLEQALGVPARRMLGAGRADDIGDIDGVPDLCVQVAYRKDVGYTLRHKAAAAERQQANGSFEYGCTMVLMTQTGGRPPIWRFVMTPKQFFDLYRAATDDGNE